MQVLNSPSGQTGSCKGLLGEAHLAKDYQVKHLARYLLG